MKALRLILVVFGLGLICAPALAEGLNAPQGRAALTVSGKIANTNGRNVAKFDLAMLDQLPQHSIKTSTPWFDAPKTFSGPLARDLMKLVGAQGGKVKAIALNDYATNIPIQDFQTYDVVLATRIDGETLNIREKGPVFVIYPFDLVPETKNEIFFQRCIWQLVQIKVE
ncbi:hypothetical protein [Hahella sp. HN01]|uniref:hypothetical protein n=1 Tax=Hahella sp. HN01 TaxID=2847262 RepID=UPI001C1EDA10|nr:hypothetical protein [Hahella sp. HN01]MBU6951061.1 hypothetical protein [Hahella sp. HN01]